MAKLIEIKYFLKEV